MWKRTMQFAEWQTPEQRKAQVTMWQRHDAQRLTMCNGLQFWRICRHSECKRRHACSGDPHACFTRHWAAVPEDEKNWLRAGIKARAEGLTPQAAARAAEPNGRAMSRPRRRTKRLRPTRSQRRSSTMPARRPCRACAGCDV